MNILTCISLFFLLAVALMLGAAAAFRTVRRNLCRRRGAFAALAALAAACTILAQKPSISFDRLISDAGSYATNDVLHVAATNAGAYAAFDFSGSDLLVYRRERGLTNAADWVECLPRRKYGDLPADWHVPDATNYDYLVAVDYVPPSSVHTNGVFELRGFVVPSAASGTRSAAFATSTIADRREIVPVEYLESTGTQWIDTGIDTSTISKYVTDTAMLGVGAEGSNVVPYIFIGIHGSKLFYGYVGVSSPTAIPADNDRHIFEAANTGVVANDGFYIDGVKAKDRGTGTVASAPFYLFACYQPGNLRFYLRQRKYSAKIYCNGVLVRDYIPVRVGTVGYLFDLVSGEYLPFGNKGTGAFIVGPDIKE